MLPVSLFELARASAGDSCCEGVSEGPLDVFVLRMSGSGPEVSSVFLATGLVVDEGSTVTDPSSEEMGSSVVGIGSFACVVEGNSLVVKDAIPAVALSSPSSAAEPDCPAYHHLKFKIALWKAFVMYHMDRRGSFV